MKMSRVLSFVVCCLALILLSGCATTLGSSSYNEEGASLDVSILLRFNDVPTPAGFKILDKASFAFQNDTTRVALLKYIGPKNADIVVAFYKEHMPMYNWNPINIIEYERRIMNYEKGAESCIITIETKGSKSIVTIAISPKSRPMKVQKKEK